jgi:hypothetical protein
VSLVTHNLNGFSSNPSPIIVGSGFYHSAYAWYGAVIYNAYYVHGLQPLLNCIHLV